MFQFAKAYETTNCILSIDTGGLTVAMLGHYLTHRCNGRRVRVRAQRQQFAARVCGDVPILRSGGGSPLGAQGRISER
jgi:hypothetical protein